MNLRVRLAPALALSLLVLVPSATIAQSLQAPPASSIDPPNTSIDVYGTALINRMTFDRDLCSSPGCAPVSTTGPGFSVGAGITANRLRMAGEVSVGSPLDLRFAAGPRLRTRDVLLSVLGGVEAPRWGVLSGTALAGVTFVSTRGDGYIGPSEGQRPFDADDSSLTLTFGGDVTLSLGSRVRLIVPVRLTRIPEEQALLRRGLDTRVGVGVTTTVWSGLR